VVLSSWQAIVRVHPVHMTMQTERQVAANLQTKSSNLGCDAAGWLLPSTSTIAICYYYSALKLNSLCHPTKDGLRLRRPRHCSEGVQPVPSKVTRR